MKPKRSSRPLKRNQRNKTTKSNKSKFRNTWLQTNQKLNSQKKTIHLKEYIYYIIGLFVSLFVRFIRIWDDEVLFLILVFLHHHSYRNFIRNTLKLKIKLSSTISRMSQNSKSVECHYFSHLVSEEFGKLIKHEDFASLIL